MRLRPIRNARRSSDTDRSADERGFVLVWFALLIVVMLSVAAFAVDLGHAYYVGQQAQDAADVSALSASPYLPDNCANADPHAISIAGLNGFPNSGNTQVTAENGASGGAGCDANPLLLPNQIQVDVTTKVDTWFARAIGIDSLTVSRSSTAEFDPPVQLGSPHGYFGNMPGCNTCEQPSIWASVAGQANRKVDGNAIFENWCTGTTTADNCDANGPNTDHDQNGMLFEITNPTGAPLNIELYDPGFAAGALTCTAPCDPTTWPGDEVLSQKAGVNPPLSTVYTLYPLDNLNNPLGNPAACTATYPGYASAPPVGATDLTAQSFHKWANFGTDASCGALSGTSYVLQVQSGDELGGAPQAGVNNFSIAACTGCNANQPSDDNPGSNVDVSAITKMSIFANAPPGASNPKFYLARVPSWARGQFLTLNFFDVGDISGNSGGGSIPGNLIVTAKDATHGAGGAPIGEFSNCTYSHPDSRGNTAADYISGKAQPWTAAAQDTDWAENPGTLSPMAGPCTAAVTVNGSASFWNGKWVTWKIPIPRDYTCDDKNVSSCWLQIQYNYVNAQFHDATTWTAVLSGNPVRLTK